MADFDPLRLHSFATLNRTRLAEVAAVEPGLRGCQASDLLSAGALRRAIGAAAGRLGLERELAAGEDLLPAFDRCLAAPDASVRRAAEELAGRFGKHLGYLLISLAGQPSTAGNEGEMSEAYRAHWSRVRHVVLGGGVVSGNLGPAMLEASRRIVRASLASEFELELVQYPRQLGLIGAALGLQDVSATTALVYDFGGSWIKRACAFYDNRALVRLDLHASVAVTPSLDPWDRQEPSLRRLGETMSRIIARDWRDGKAPGLALSNEVVCAVNAYVQAELPSDAYSAMRALDGRHDWLSDAVSMVVGQRLNVRLAHDGTAAARTLAGKPIAAVIMLGTWLGVGFPPPRNAVRQLTFQGKGTSLLLCVTHPPG